MTFKFKPQHVGVGLLVGTAATALAKVTTPKPVPQPEPTPSAEQAEAQKWARVPKTPPGAAQLPFNDATLVVGMNKGARLEAQVLGQGGRTVELVGPGTKDTITTNSNGQKVTHQLSTAEGARSFAATLGLPAEQADQVAQIVQRDQPDARDELAAVAQVWARAERGESVPSRLVLSGHNVGTGIWGDDNGRLSFDALARLPEAMPQAARQIEDLHLSACYSGDPKSMVLYKNMFPNLKTIWAYDGSAPGWESGSKNHLAVWRQATAGRVESVDRGIATSLYKGHLVSTVDAQGHYDNGKPQAILSELQARYQQSRAATQGFFEGISVVQDSQSGPLRDHYNNIQNLLGRLDITSEQRTALEGERDVAIRLLYYASKVAPAFQKHYGSQMARAYEAVGMRPPNFGQLSRAQALAGINEFASRASGRADLGQASTLLEGLRSLSREVIPETWI